MTDPVIIGNATLYLGNSVVPAQAYPFFEAIAIMDGAAP